MSLSGLIPTDVSINAAIAICAIAFVSGTARGFSGFGSALIFMPLASSIAAPRLVAALLLIIDFVAAAPLLPNAWKQADRKATAIMVIGALVGVPIGTYFLSRLDPVTTRWIISGFVLALLLLLLSGWRYRGKDHAAHFRRHRRACRASAAGWRRPAARRSSAIGSAARSHPSIARANILLFFGASDFFSLVSYVADRADHRGCDQVLAAWSVRSTASASGSAPRCSAGQRNAVSRDLLRPDRGRRHHRPAGARRRAAARGG